MKVKNKDRRVIFQCYGRDDKVVADQFRECLVRHLKTLPEEMRCDYWYDGEVLCGEKWEETILEKLEESALGVVLISPSMLASDFIRNEELPRLIAEERLLMPVLLMNVISAADYQGLKEWQIFAREVRGKRQSFYAQRTLRDREVFVREFCEDLMKQLKK